uniref:Large ribosomal subunit protein eL28 n=1 Tax=Rhinolophus ferrumequinum TaxID=59479 RepID=A0A671F565_RHIFE
MLLVPRPHFHFLIKRNKQMYSTEPSNLKACNSFCYNGLIHWKTVGMEPAQRSSQPKPATSYVRATINKNAQATLSSIRHMTCKNKYHPDLRMASASLRSQKPVTLMRKWACPRSSSVPPPPEQ